MENKYVPVKTVALFLLLILCSGKTNAQWLDWAEETTLRLTVSSVATTDPEEKDMWNADLNNDGREDLIVVRKQPFSTSTQPGKSNLLLMNVNGIMTDQTSIYAPEFISTVNFARDVFVGDFDGDNWKDVVVANTFNQQPMYYRNRGTDSLGNWLGLINESSTRFPILNEDVPLFCAVWGGDVTGDGAMDIYFVNYKVNSGGGTAKDYLLINNGSGVFTNESAARLGTLRNSAFGTAVQIVDMDNDGDKDVVKNTTLYSVAPWNARGVIVLFNNGTGTFTNWQNLVPTSSPYMFEVADFNLDGKKDLYVVDDGSDYMLRLITIVPDTSLTFIKTNLNFSSSNGFGGNVHAADLDLDGDMDIGVADVDVDIPPCLSSRRMAIYRNDSGVFTNVYGTTAYAWAKNCYDFAWLDINNDGLQDFIQGKCSGYGLFMNDNCALAPSPSDYDLDGLADACDPCPTNPDPNCAPPTNFPTVSTSYSIARQWNEMLLASIRKDFARPTVHARNLFHVSAAMWDAWAIYDSLPTEFLLGKTVRGYTVAFNGLPPSANIESDRHKAITYAAYRLLKHRFTNSPQAALLYMGYDFHMDTLGYDKIFTSVDYSTGDARALGNYIAQSYISFGLQDGSNEQNGYANTSYAPVNPPLNVDVPGNPNIINYNSWQPLTLDLFIDQSGNPIPGATPPFLSPEWGKVVPFALDSGDLTVNQRNAFNYNVYHDPGPPPLLQMDGSGTSDQYKYGFALVSTWSSHLDPTDGVMWDISPATQGNRTNLPATFADYPNFYNQLSGGTTNVGHTINPKTGLPYTPNMVPRGDYARVLAEFWADGPDSETPPGHWFSLFNYVTDHPAHTNRYRGTGPVLNDLEWDVKGYFALGGAMHDVAISVWGMKGWYDYLRPISAIRGMAALGQSSNSGGPSYHPAGLPLIPGYIEVVGVGDSLANGTTNVGKIKLKAWRGHSFINNVDVDEAGVSWILAQDWLPYQRPSFVTPPFAGYISGHSTYSRAAAEILTDFTGDNYFPGGLGVFNAQQNQFLVFEDGPSVNIQLQWATYQDAADESSLSRIWGGIHPPCDDIPGRKIAVEIAEDVFARAEQYFFPLTTNLRINLKAFMEGLKIPGTDSMIAVLDPVNYPGLCDSITVQLVDSATLAVAASDQQVISVSGNGVFNFSGLQPNHRYYLAVKYRNALETWSKYSFLFTKGLENINFTPW
jgi:FG-GAP-like repeat